MDKSGHRRHYGLPRWREVDHEDAQNMLLCPKYTIIHDIAGYNTPDFVPLYDGISDICTICTFLEHARMVVEQQKTDTRGETELSEISEKPVKSPQIVL